MVCAEWFWVRCTGPPSVCEMAGCVLRLPFPLPDSLSPDRPKPNARPILSTLHAMRSLSLFLFPAVLGLMFVMAPELRAEPAVSGTFKGDGKEAKLAHCTSRKGEPTAGKATTVLVFTEKDHSKDAQAEIKAGFGEFGSALIVTVDSDGEIVGCEVAHTAHKKSPFSSTGKVRMSDYKNAGGEVMGKLSTGGEVETFKQKWQVELTFHTKAP